MCVNQTGDGDQATGVDFIVCFDSPGLGDSLYLPAFDKNVYWLQSFADENLS
jgi:hypothetical protein